MCSKSQIHARKHTWQRKLGHVVTRWWTCNTATTTTTSLYRNAGWAQHLQPLPSNADNLQWSPKFPGTLWMCECTLYTFVCMWRCSSPLLHPPLHSTKSMECFDMGHQTFTNVVIALLLQNIVPLSSQSPRVSSYTTRQTCQYFALSSPGLTKNIQRFIWQEDKEPALSRDEAPERFLLGLPFAIVWV